MKFSFTILSLIVLLGCWAVIFSSATPITSDEITSSSQKRFLGSVGGWISGAVGSVVDAVNDNVIQPISGVVGTGVSGINNIVGVVSQGVTTIKDPIVGFVNSISHASSSLSSTVISTINTIMKPTQLVANLVLSQIVPTASNQQGDVDLCKEECFSRVNVNNQLNDYYFNQGDNGCISKGYLDAEYTEFDSCCDAHNLCLNARCCTNDCQVLKNECDKAFETCTREKCVPHISDTDRFWTCMGRGARISSSAVNSTCDPTETRSRRLCYCHVEF